jgi:fluoride exporter
MTVWAVVLMAVAGGIGAVARFVLDSIVRMRVEAYPLGTMIINLSGSFLLGLVVGLTGHVLSPEWRLVLGTGFLGGYTTFSTASVETVRLLQAGRYASAVVNGLGMLVLSVLAAAVGLWLGSL